MEISKVFVIIVTFNGKQWYDRCFSSLRNSELAVQTVVIDNASSDDTVQYIQANYPEVHLIASNTNLGFGQANNKGIKYSLDNNADYVFLLNQDAWIESDALEKLVKIHQENKQFGILSPMHLNIEKNAIERSLLCYIDDHRITDRQIVNDLYFDRLKEVYETKFVNAAAWLIPKTTIEVVGGFDPIFFHYGEDDNYMHRTFYHGFNIGLCPKVRVVHDTERRSVKKGFAEYQKKVYLLTQFVDINKSLSIPYFVFSRYKSALFKLIKLQGGKSRLLIAEANYIFSLKSKIKKSRLQNVKNAISWL